MCVVGEKERLVYDGCYEKAERHFAEDEGINDFVAKSNQKEQV